MSHLYIPPRAAHLGSVRSGSPRPLSIALLAFVAPPSPPFPHPPPLLVKSFAIPRTRLPQARMEEFPRRFVSAPPSFEETHRPLVPRLPAPRLRSPRLRLAGDAFPRPHDTCVSTKDSAQLARTSPWVRAHTAGSVCGKPRLRRDPAGRIARICAQHRNSAAAPGNNS